MHRATQNNSSLRSYTSGGARATLDKVNDNSLMQESSANMMTGEARQGIESAQNYGFTSHNFQAVKDAMGKMLSSAETFVSFMGGNRAFPTCGPIDDRRHRLRGLGEGDCGMHRGKDDDMQVHLASDGMYHSAPQMVRVQLVQSGSGKANPPQQKPQATQATQAQRVQLSLYARNGPYIEDRLWAGLEPELQLELDGELVRELARLGIAAAGVTPFAESGGAGSGGGASANGGGQGQGDKPTGQKAVNGAGKDSKDFMHVKKEEGRLSSAKKVRLSNGKDDDDVLHESSKGQDWVGGTPDKHKFSAILTLAGPSINGKARIG